MSLKVNVTKHDEDHPYIVDIMIAGTQEDILFFLNNAHSPLEPLVLFSLSRCSSKEVAKTETKVYLVEPKDEVSKEES